MGHVLYRFGQFPLAKGKLHLSRLLNNRLLAKPHAFKTDDWRWQWVEEIFADAYGCLVAGPISVLGFQMMLADGLPQPLHAELGDHPLPVLRPLLQSQILRKMRTQDGNVLFPEAPALLDARWQRWVVENWPQWVAEKWLDSTGQSDLIRDASFTVAGQMRTGQEILDALDPVIEVVLQTLTSIRPADKEATWTPNWDPASHSGRLAGVTGLYAAFGEFATRIASTALQESFQTAEVVVQSSQAVDDLLQQYAGNDTDGWRARSAGIDGLIEMVLFEGWSTEGPGPRQVGG